MHGARPYQPQTTCVTNGSGQSPAATPNHTGLDYGVFNIKKLPYWISLRVHILVQKTNIFALFLRYIFEYLIIKVFKAMEPQIFHSPELSTKN
jgi:hypothetical protein